MTPSNQAKKYGAKNLKEVADKTGYSVGQLSYMHKHYPEAFRFTCMGIMFDSMLDKYKRNK